MRTPKSLIFDLDGTLIHSAPDIHAAINVALKDAGRAELSLATATSFIGNGVDVLVKRCLEATGGTEDALHAATLAHFLEVYNADPYSRTAPYPGVVACLDRLQAQGHKMAICTNKPTAPAKDICAALGLSAYFDVIEGATPGKPKKPDAAPLLGVMNALGHKAEDTVYVGDSTVDQATAQNAGLAFVLFSGGYLNAPLSGAAPALIFDDWACDWLAALSQKIYPL